MQHTEFTNKYFSKLDLKHEKIHLFYQFLQISPSYRAAHMYVEHDADEPSQSDFDRVLITYRDFGDVWANDFQTWWSKYARNYFPSKPQYKPATIATLKTVLVREDNDQDVPYLRLVKESTRKVGAYIASTHVENGYPNLALIAVPLDGDKEKTESEVKKLLQAEWPKTKSNETAAKYSLQRNKIRALTLEKCLYAVHQYALNLDANDKSLVELGLKITKKYKHNKEKGVGGENGNRILRSQTSNMLTKALNIAENAARGEFPKTEANERTCAVKTDNLASHLKDKQELREEERLQFLENKNLNIQQYFEQKNAQENTPTDLPLEDEPKTYEIKFDYDFIAGEIKNERIPSSAKKHTKKNTAKKHNKIT